MVSELVDSCDGIYSKTVSERFEREVDDFLRVFKGGYIFDVVVWLDS